MIISSSIFRLLFILITINLNNFTNQQHTNIVNASPIVENSNQPQASANEASKKTAAPIKTNSNVYGADTDSLNKNQNQNAANRQQQNPQAINRGYNQGYSYNTGIKPYRTGYTYFQPFGDNVNQKNENDGNGGGVVVVNNNNNDNNTQELPIELPNFFGIDPKQLGPVRVIQNKNLPLDENGIPILDQIHIPENDNNNNNDGNNQQVNQPAQPRQVPAPPVPVPPVEVPVNANDFTDFNLNNLLSGNTNTNDGKNNEGLFSNNQNNANNNDDGMFDFSPPSRNNFNFARPGLAGADQSDYNRLDDFAGNLNNFDTYLGDDPSLMLDGNMDMINGDNNNSNNGNAGKNQGQQIPNTGLDGFGFGGQQVPSEIVNLNNAFGTGSSSNTKNQRGGDGNLSQILNQFGNPNSNTNNQMFPFSL